MPIVAFYTHTEQTTQQALVQLKTIHTGMCKDLPGGVANVASKRAQATMKDVAECGSTVDKFERIKIEVKDYEAALELSNRDDFVRFAIGGYSTLEDLVISRKQAGRSDWYV